MGKKQPIIDYQLPITNILIANHFSEKFFNKLEILFSKAFQYFHGFDFRLV